MPPFLCAMNFSYKTLEYRLDRHDEFTFQVAHDFQNGRIIFQNSCLFHPIQWLLPLVFCWILRILLVLFQTYFNLYVFYDIFWNVPLMLPRTQRHFLIFSQCNLLFHTKNVIFWNGVKVHHNFYSRHTWVLGWRSYKFRIWSETRIWSVVWKNPSHKIWLCRTNKRGDIKLISQFH